MRVLILGASGGCGQWLTRLAVAAGHSVTIITRQPGGEPWRDGAQTIVGDPLDADLLTDAVARQDVVLSALGIRRASRNPWSPLLSPPDFTSQVMHRLVPVMVKAGVNRLLAISAAGVGDSAPQLTAPVRTLLSLGHVGLAYRDLAVMEAILTASPLRCTIVRPVTLVDGDVTGRATPVNRFGLMSTIRRADVAQWMVARLTDPDTRTGSRFVTLGT